MHRAHLPKDRVTIQDVAKHAGVSTMTVSNVFRGKGKVSPATRDRVLHSIQVLGYRPDPRALRLKGATIARVGLIYFDVESMFINGTIAAVSLAAAERGLQLLVRKSSNATPAQAFALADDLVAAGAEAIVLIPPFAELLAEGSGERSVAVPMVALATAAALPGISTVRIDNFEAAFSLTEKLVLKGRRRIGLAGGPLNHSDSRARLEGYRAALQKHALPVAEGLCRHGDFTFASGVEIGEMLLGTDAPPDAIVSANDDMAAGVLWAAHRMGVAVPAELSVTGFDDTLLATRVWPALTTVRQPVAVMAGRALDLAIEMRMADDARDVVLPFTMVERGST